MSNYSSNSNKWDQHSSDTMSSEDESDQESGQYVIF